MSVRGNIQFKPLNESHFDLMLRWFNKPHVQVFYSLKTWTYEKVYKKLEPYVRKEKQISSFIIYLENHPIGYIQSWGQHRIRIIKHVKDFSAPVVALTRHFLLTYPVSIHNNLSN